MPNVPLPFHLHFYEQTGSTNDDAIALAKAGADEFTLVWALAQTKGRGRFNRTWLSERGNLYWSCIVHLDKAWLADASINFAVAVAIGETIGRFVGSDKKIEYKWPNDVIVGGRKVSGVLIEGNSDTGWLVIGIGINVEISPPKEANMLHPPTCINDISDNRTSVEDVCWVLCEEVHRYVTIWKSEGFSGVIRRKYEQSLWRVGETVRVSFNADKTEGIEGINLGIDQNGYMKLKRSDGTIETVVAADVLYGKGNIT